MICVAAYLLPAAGAAAKPMAPALDQKRIHAAYTEGEFDLVTRELVAFSEIHQSKDWLRVDSVFLFKHLAVIYVANRETREKGKYYMNSMLRIMPKAEILDMYVSEEVDAIFLRTRQEFLHNRRMSGADTAEVQTTAEGKGKGVGESGGEPGRASSTKGWNWNATAWTTGGLLLAAAGATTAILLIDGTESKSRVNTILVPSKTK